MATMNFPEIWLYRVISIITSLDQAPWLDGIPELDVDVVELGAGTASEQNIIHLPVENFNPEVLINNSSYPISLQSFTDTEATVALDKYQTKVTTLSDDQIIGAAYNRIDSATRGHTRQINTVKFKKAIHAIAPTGDSAKTPVIEVAAHGNDLYQSIVSLKDAFDKAEVPEDDRRLVLCTDHMNTILLDRKRFGSLLYDMNTGKLSGVIAGFKIYSYNGTPVYNASLQKVTWGAVPTSTDQPASIAFYGGNIAKKTGLTKQYFAPSDQDPQNQTNKINYRHYFIAVPAKNEMIGAIVGRSIVTPVTGVEFIPSENQSVALSTGTVQLDWAVKPQHASDKRVTFESGTTGVATVDANGLITLVGEGTSVITVKTVDGEETDSFTLTVTND